MVLDGLGNPKAANGGKRRPSFNGAAAPLSSLNLVLDCSRIESPTPNLVRHAARDAQWSNLLFGFRRPPAEDSVSESVIRPSARQLSAHCRHASAHLCVASSTERPISPPLSHAAAHASHTSAQTRAIKPANFVWCMAGQARQTSAQSRHRSAKSIISAEQPAFPRHSIAQELQILEHSKKRSMFSLSLSRSRSKIGFGCTEIAFPPLVGSGSVHTWA